MARTSPRPSGAQVHPLRYPLGDEWYSHVYSDATLFRGGGILRLAVEFLFFFLLHQARFFTKGSGIATTCVTIISCLCLQ